MERAAHTFTQWLSHLLPQAEHDFHIFCGNGNNGGDGMALARMLHRKFHNVQVYTFPLNQKGSEDFLTNRERLPKGVQVVELGQSDWPNIPHRHIIIDALLGAGLSRPLSGSLEELVLHLNAQQALRVSIDIPSGLFADKLTTSTCLLAHHCLSFQAPKLAFFFSENYPALRHWDHADIGLHPGFTDENPSLHHFTLATDAAQLLHRRDTFAHKGDFGHALLVAGSKGMAGAAILAARACMAAGCGKLTCLVPLDCLPLLQVAIPEALCWPDEEAGFISEVRVVDGYDAIAIGPGLGQDPKTAQALVQFLQRHSKPLLLDADALNLIAQSPALLRQVPKGSIITPHPKEFDRLFGAVGNSWERLEKAQKKAQELQLIIVLKGAYTAVVLPNGRVHFNATGNPGMATAGSGDVLTGILVGLLAQGYAAEEAAILGVYLHGAAGDKAMKNMGMESMLASDITRYLGYAFQFLHGIKG